MSVTREVPVARPKEEAALEVSMPSRIRKLRRRVVGFLSLERTIAQLLSVFLLLVFWQVVGSRLNEILMSTPTRVVGEFWKMTVSGELPLATMSTLQIFLSAFALAILMGVPLGLLTGYYRIVQNFVDIWVRVLYVMPSIAVMPVLIGWLGIGTALKIAVAYHSAFFVILINTDAGVRNVDKTIIDVAKSFNASSWQTFTKVILPGSVPFIMAGLRVGIARAILGTIVAEMFASASGLGFLLLRYGNIYFTARVFAILIVLAAISLLASAVVERAEARFAKWRTS